MSSKLLILSVVICTTSSWSQGTEAESDLIGQMARKAATNAVHLMKDGQTNEANQAFAVFLGKWQAVETNQVYDKLLHTDAAKCFLTFGKADKATQILTNILMRTGRGLPPSVRYLLVRSEAAQGNHKGVLEGMKCIDWQSESCPKETRQEIGLLGARAWGAVTNQQQSVELYEKVIAWGPDTAYGKTAKQELDRLHAAKKDDVH